MSDNALPDRMIGYVRVSRVGGREGPGFISPEDQEKKIETWGREKGVEIVWPPGGHELDQSGGNADRPILQKALRLVESPRSPAGGIVVAKLDRLSRSLRDALEIFRQIQDAGGQVACVDPPIDSATATGRMQRDLLMLLADWELGRIREQWATAVAKATARDVHVASGAPFGYRRKDKVPEHQQFNDRGDVAKDGRLVIDPMEGPLVTRAFEMYARDHASLQKIADMLNAEQDRMRFSPPRIGELLDRRTYLGETGSGETVNTDAHKALVSPGLFAAAQKRRQDRKKVQPRDGVLSKDALLIGLVRCASCGHAMTVHGSTRPDTKERIAGYMCPRGKLNCSKPAYGQVKLVDDFVLTALAEDPAGAEDSRRAAEVRLVEARTRLDEVEAANKKLRDWEFLYRLGEQGAKEVLEQAKEAYDAALAELYEAQMAVQDADLPEDAEIIQVGDIRTVKPKDWDEMTTQDLRRHLRRYISKVEIQKADKRGRWDRIENRVTVRWVGGGVMHSKRLLDQRKAQERSASGR